MTFCLVKQAKSRRWCGGERLSHEKWEMNLKQETLLSMISHGFSSTRKTWRTWNALTTSMFCNNNSSYIFFWICLFFMQNRMFPMFVSLVLPLFISMAWRTLLQAVYQGRQTTVWLGQTSLSGTSQCSKMSQMQSPDSKELRMWSHALHSMQDRLLLSMWRYFEETQVLWRPLFQIISLWMQISIQSISTCSTKVNSRSSLWI